MLFRSTMNHTWGYSITDKDYKSEKELIHYLIKAAGNNANLLMNVGPRPNGEFPDIAIQRYIAMGEWLKEYGETIYETRGGFVEPCDWGVTTQKGNILYVHILNKDDETLYLPILDKDIISVKRFIDNKPIQYTRAEKGVLLNLNEVPEDIDYVLEIKLR